MPTPLTLFPSVPEIVRRPGAGLLLVLAGAFLQACAVVSTTQNFPQESAREIRPGVLHREILDERGPWRIQVLEIDLRHRDLVLETARALDSTFGRETTSGIAARHRLAGENVLAALNADFFDMKTGEAINNQVARGIVTRALRRTPDERGEYSGVRSQVGFLADRKPVLGKFVFDGRVIWKNGSAHHISAVNVVRAWTDLVLFNRYIGPETPPDTLGRDVVELVLRTVRRAGDTSVAVVMAGGRGRSPIPSDGFVLASLRNPMRFDSAGVAPGDTVRVLIGFPPSPPGLRALVGGLPQLIRAGTLLLDTPEGLEGAGREFATTRHPRTGIGFSSDSMIVKFVVVDGRQSQSVGMTLREFSELMLSLGLHHALNLDGGGSTTMVVGDRVVNSPSDASGERPVANAVLLLERPTAEREK